MKPLVLPYKTALGHYFYETQKNEIVSVSKELFEYIKAIIDGNEIKMAMSGSATVREYEELVSCGYLAATHIKKIQHGATYRLPELLDRRLDRIVLQVTQRCNLRCSYCIYSENSNLGTRSHSNQSMNFETAKKAVDFYFRHSIDNDIFAIAFYGGEPLLEFDLIKETVEYAKKVFEGKELIFAITTNATLMNDKVIDFFIENRFSITVSIDGPKSIHDKNRRFVNGNGSYDVVIQNITKLKEKSKGNIPIAINMVVDSNDNYDEIVSAFNHPTLSDLNLSYSFIEEDDVTAPININYLESDFYNNFLGLISYFRDNQNNYPNNLVKSDIDTIDSYIKRFNHIPLFEESAPGGPCIPGKMRLLVDYKGALFPCERVSETSSCMEIGSLDNGFNIRKVDKLLNIAQLTEDKCKNCWAFPICTVCAKYANNGDSLCPKKKLDACKMSEDNAYNKLIIISLAHENFLHERDLDRMEVCKI